jgi:hypothetical protein
MPTSLLLKADIYVYQRSNRITATNIANSRPLANTWRVEVAVI